MIWKRHCCGERERKNKKLAGSWEHYLRTRLSNEHLGQRRYCCKISARASRDREIASLSNLVSSSDPSWGPLWWTEKKLMESVHSDDTKWPWRKPQMLNFPYSQTPLFFLFFLFFFFSFLFFIYDFISFGRCKTADNMMQTWRQD